MLGIFNWNSHRFFFWSRVKICQFRTKIVQVYSSKKLNCLIQFCNLGIKLRSFVRETKNCHCSKSSSVFSQFNTHESFISCVIDLYSLLQRFKETRLGHLLRASLRFRVSLMFSHKRFSTDNSRKGVSWGEKGGKTAPYGLEIQIQTAIRRYASLWEEWGSTVIEKVPPCESFKVSLS